MRYIAQHRLAFCGCVAGALCALAAFYVGNIGAAAQSGEAGTLSVAVPFSARLLRQAGATPADLAKFKYELTQMWPEDQRSLEQYLEQRSPADLVKYVQRLQHPSPDDQYVQGADYEVRRGVPQGKTFEFTLDHSSIFPGTTRRIRVYIPAQYAGNTPACVYVSLDDLFFSTPRAFDNLIDKHEVPVLIAIGVSPGVVDSIQHLTDPRFDRSLEFDGLNDNLARFLLEEVFPEVEQHRTPDGLPIRLSKSPNDRAVGGVSTGAIGAFTLAWQRPDAFRRVFTGIGTFVGMRGGDRYPVLVRKTEPKPIRIFMQDGSNDQLTDVLGEVGDWWMSNQTMERALEFAGYQVAHVWGEGTHNTRHSMAVLPQAMRWLWKDWPRPVIAGESQNTFLKQILRPEQGWQFVPGSYRSVRALASDRNGLLLFWDAVSHQAWRVAGNGPAIQSHLLDRPYAGMAYGPDGRAYVTDATDHKIVARDSAGKSSIIAQDIRGENLVVSHAGDIYVTEPSAAENGTGKVWLIKPSGERRVLDSGLNVPSGIALSPDGLWLAVAEYKTHWGYSYRIRADGSVDDKQRFYWFHVADEADDSGAGQWAMDREGRLYSATRMGVQVFDRNGRVRAILPVPGGEVSGLAFGGPQFDTLYVSCADGKVYRRLLKTTGAQPWAAPVTLPAGIAG